jgi:NTP pyrophosphatase (non-canonical NTP hydrolase)
VDFNILADRLRRFAEERDWVPFHTPKNLAMALAAEAGELLELFQWLTPEESAALDTLGTGAVADELADVLLYAVRLADIIEVDLNEAVERKLASNAEKYPVDSSKGHAHKYYRVRRESTRDMT